MKVKFNKAALQEALGLVTSVVPSRTPKPILQCLHVKAQKDTVQVSATDLEAGINYQLSQVEVLSEGDIIVPADKLSAIVSTSIDEVLELEASEATVHIRGSDSHFTIYSHESSQYPAVAGFDGDACFEAGLRKLQEGIELCIFATARESTRYALNGVLWEVSGKKLTLVATDGRRLARSTVGLDSSAGKNMPDGRIIVPAKTMQLLGRISADEKTKVAVRFVNNQVVLSCENIVVSSTLIEGNFPKYDDIIPKDYQRKLTLSTAATLSAVRRAALLTNEDSKGIKLSLKKGELIFSARAPETGDAQIDMAVEYDGAPIEIGFNPQFLIDALRVIKADDFELHLGESDRPGLLKSQASFLYIVMPVNL